MGAKICWYNDLEPNGVGTNDFTLFGARRCKQAGIKVVENFTDINIICANKKVYIYNTGKMLASYRCDYAGANSLRNPTAKLVEKVFLNKYGTGDTRITNLIRVNYRPKGTNEKVTKVITLAKQIINNEVNYGKNEERIKNIDAKLGKGYGQLVQDEINSLLKAKTRKW